MGVEDDEPCDDDVEADGDMDEVGSCDDDDEEEEFAGVESVVSFFTGLHNPESSGAVQVRPYGHHILHPPILVLLQS